MILFMHLKPSKITSEIKHMVDAHYEDGLALTKFIYWIKHNKKKLMKLMLRKN